VSKAWFGRNRSLIITVTSGFVVAVVVAVTAAVSSGYAAQQLNLNDSSVWVANGVQQAIGRANTTVRTLNSVVSTTGNDLDILQHASTVLLVDNANSKLETVDPATSTVTESIPLPPGKPEVFLTQNNVIILAQTTGQLWMTSLDDLPTFDSQSPAAFTLGAGAVASVDDAGTLFTYSPSQKQVYRIAPDESDSVQQTDALTVNGKDDLSISSAADHWAVLDATTSRLYTAAGSVSLD